MARITFDSCKRLVPKGFATLMAVVFFIMVSGGVLNAQDNKINFGFRGGLGMSTLAGFENNGLKVGFTGGVCAQYDLQNNQHLVTELYYSTGGQHSQKMINVRDGQMKIYSKYALHYLSIPILYQYYFTDILGIEAGPNFSYCMGGSIKTKVGNGSWEKTKFSHDDYNAFDFGLIVGVFTSNLIPNEDVFVSLKAYFGFLDVMKGVGSNKNLSIQVSVGYMLF